MKKLLIASAVAGAVFAGPALSQTIDFSDARGNGLSSDQVLIENIRVIVPVPNPFDPASSTTSTATYNVVFRFDPNTLHLVPAGISQVDPALNCAQLTVEVFDALLGARAPISGAVVALGSQTAITNDFGAATFSGLPQGPASLTVSAGTRAPVTQTATLTCAQPNQVTVALSPATGTPGGLNQGQFRVITTWGEHPRDLDSHMTGPNADGSRWHVYFGDKTAGGVCGLDVDDMSSYGPETITCPSTGSQSELRPGIYRYSVRHFVGSNTVGTSGATVRLEFENGSTYTYTPPENATYSGSNDVWTVFELTVNTDRTISVAPVNTVTSVSSTSGVRGGHDLPSPTFGRVEDPALFLNIDSK